MRGRLRRIAKWVGLISFTVLVPVYVLSIWKACHFSVPLMNRTVFCGFDGGALLVVVLLDTTYPSPGFGVTDASYFRLWLEHSNFVGFGHMAWIPIWMLLAALALPTALLWHTDRRRPIPSGQCRKCGYDLTGNVSGRCPECGKGT